MTFELTVVDKLAATQSGVWTVGVSHLPSLPAGGNFIGSVGIQALPPIPTGSNFIGNVGIPRLPALSPGNNLIGKVTIDSLPIGNVNVIGAVPIRSMVDPLVGILLNGVTSELTGSIVACSHAYKTFSFLLTGTGSATIKLFGSADNMIYVPLATFAMDSVKTPTDGLTTGATSYTKFYVVVSDITGTPALDGSVLGVF